MSKQKLTEEILTIKCRKCKKWITFDEAWENTGFCKACHDKKKT
jgi:hypothetical protein